VFVRVSKICSNAGRVAPGDLLFFTTWGYLMFRLSSVSQAALVLCVGSVAASAYAQAVPTSELKPVEVTGSRIKRMDTETASPIQVITREQIERSGATSVTEVLKSVPANNAGAFDENAVASFTPGAGGVSLRGLGAQATLVLINGRRVAPFGFASGGQQTFVDVNSIPLDAVERIETLLDGASAIYGSDAIAGVVNVILRKDFNGFSGSASLGTSAYSDANSPSFALTYGKGSLATDKHNFFVNFSHTQRDAVKASERPNTETADFRRFGLLDQRSSYSYPGTLYTVGGLAGAAFRSAVVGCTPLADGSSLNGRCIYDATQHTDIVAKTERDALFLAGTADIGNGNELFGDASFMRTKFRQESPSYSTSTYYSTGTLPTAAIILPVGHPQNVDRNGVPYTTESMIRYRFADVLHNTEVQSDTQRIVFGGRGTWLGWDAESALLYSRSSTGVTTTGLINDSVLLNDVLDADGKANSTFNFGNPAANDAGLMARLYPSLRDQGTTSTSSLDVHGSKELTRLAGGPLGLAMGVELRRESFTSTPDPLVAAGALSVLGASSADGNRNISALFAELSAPVFKTVETSLAARVDRYSDFGSAVTPKAAVKWKISPTFAVRGTYSEGFRAPALTELSSSPSRGFYTGIRDPLLCPVPDTANANCDLSIEALSGSNPKLQPEKSKSFTAGIVFEPTDSFSIVVDTYNVKRTDEIASIDPDYLLANEASYPGYVVRNATTNAIDLLNLQYTNLGSTHVWGMDIDVKSRFNLGEYGKLALSGSYNSEPHYMVANVKGAPEVDYAGTWQQPKERMKFGVAWDKGPWSTTATVNYTGSFLRAFTPSDLTCSYNTGAHPELCSVDSWTTTDVFVGYKGFKNLELGLNIQNIENKQAPLDERRAGRYTLFSSGYHNQLGRYMSLRAKYVFW
jgi:iron complex outermembrane receptor protein